MKFLKDFAYSTATESLPMRGEWIEIPVVIWDEELVKRSLPMRGEWIEIRSPRTHCRRRFVSPHAGRVD